VVVLQRGYRKVVKVKGVAMSRREVHGQKKRFLSKVPIHE
jgi:hypothetical protein